MPTDAAIRDMIAPMRRLVPIVAVLATLAAALAPAGASAALETLHLKRGVEVQALAAGPDETLWAAGIDRSESPPRDFLARMSPGAKPGFFIDRGDAGEGVGELIRGPEGEMWFSVPAADQIVRLDPGAEVLHHLALVAGERPTGLVAAQGDVWATLAGVPEIAQIEAGGATVINWELEPGTSLSRIVLGSDNNLWAIEAGTGRVVRESLQGAYAPVALETGEESFAGTINSDIAAGDDGNIWVSQRDRPTVGKLVPDEDGEGLNYTRYKVAGGPTTFLSPGPAHDIWFADQAGMIGSISSKGTNGEPACATKLCAAPITALARGPEGKIWFAAGNTIERFEPPPLALRLKRVSRTIGKKGELTMRIACRGGAAGQKCAGKIEVLRGPQSLERSPFRGVSGSVKEVAVPLNTRILQLLKATGHLHVRLVLVVRGEQTDARGLDLTVTR
jgi:streptogramin lyase